MKTKRLVIVLIIGLFSEMAMAQTYENNAGQAIHNTSEFDYSQFSWIDAFDSLHACMAERYPFTEWKAIDWDQKKSHTWLKILAAQNEADTVKLSEALFEYLYSIPDGHVQMIGNINKFKEARQTGGFGLNMIPIADGKIVANIVQEEGQAYSAGIRCGDEILSWKETPILDVPEMEVYNNFGGLSTNYATLEGRLISRYEVLSRDSLGTEVEITYISHETGVENTVTLTAEDDDYAIMQQAFFLTSSVNNFDDIVFYEIFEDQVGYLRVLHEGCEGETIEEVRLSEIYLEVREAITYFNEQNVDKLIIDLRLNAGGNDILGSAISGFFVDNPMFYEYITGTSDENFAIIFELITEIETPHFNGEVVVIVGPNCISTGEGIPMMLQKLPKAQVISFWGTNGSFGITPNVVLMPEGLIILFPYGRSLNEEMVIQLDTDAEMIGGIQPDVKIPLTTERVIAQWDEGKDVELEYAISTLLDVTELTAENDFMLYPNPANDYVVLIAPNINRIIFFNTAGKIIRSIIASGENHFEVNISGFKAGVYLCRIITKNRVFNHKLIITR